MGQLQAVRRHGPDAALRRRPGAVPRAPYGRKILSVAERIRERLRALEPVALDLVDESAQHAGHSGSRPGGGTHWRLAIVSPRFAGQSTVARHRLVYQALGELMHDPIHALAISARSPEETKGKQ
ncbi:MAG TPA: BolA family protein [Burkholderiales bacterium]